MCSVCYFVIIVSFAQFHCECDSINFLHVFVWMYSTIIYCNLLILVSSVRVQGDESEMTRIVV